MKFWQRYQRIISLILLIIISTPFIIITISPLVLAASTDSDSGTSWLKGILLILISFIINNFTEKNKSTLETEPLIDSNIPSTESLQKEVLGFYVNWISPDANSYQALKDNWSTMNMLAPFWYTVNPQGEIEQRYGGHQYEIASFAENRDIPVLPLINNSQTNNMILVDQETREKAINNIVELVQKYDYAGVNIDFELLPSWTRNSYTAFISGLSKEFKKIDKILTISVFPKIDVPLELQEAYDYAALASLVDRVVIMTYDKHWSSGPAGPIAPIDWVESNIQYALEYIPAEKILLGIANYGYDWPANGLAQDLSAKEAVSTALEKGAEIQWHDDYQSPYYYYWDSSGEKREVWFESASSTAFKLDLVNKYNLKGIAIWRLGNGTEEFWDIIKQKLG